MIRPHLVLIERDGCRSATACGLRLSNGHRAADGAPALCGGAWRSAASGQRACPDCAALVEGILAGLDGSARPSAQGPQRDSDGRFASSVRP